MCEKKTNKNKKLKMYKNDFLSASWKLLCLGTEKEKKNSYYSIFKSGYLTRISAPSPTIYRISSFNKETNEKKKKIKFTEYSGDYTNKAYQ